MPIQVTKYTCQFKCGKLAVSDPRKMEVHENKFCVKNPANKTCQTCTNSIYYKDSDDFRSWYCRGCKLDSMNSFLHDIHDDLMIKDSRSQHIASIWHCPNHNQSAEQPETDSFIADVKAKIDAKKSGETPDITPVSDSFTF